MFRFLLPLVGMSILFPVISQGAEWSLTGNVNQSLSYDDNVLMRVNPQGSFMYRVIPTLTFQHQTDVSEIHARALYGTQVYTDLEGFDQDIQNYGLGGKYKTENFDWGLNSNFSITPTRNTAVQNSGIFNNNSNSNTWSVSPFISYKIDELNSLTLTPSYSETTYTSSNSTTTNPSIVNSNFRNNNTFNVNLAWQRLWTERYSSGLSLFYSRFDSQQQQGVNGGTAFASNFDSVGINFSNSYLWSEKWKLIGNIGTRHTESKNGTTTNSSFGFLMDAGVNYTGEKFTSGLHFNRSLVPSSIGQLQEQTSVGLNFNYQFIERLSGSFNANYQESSFVTSGTSSTRKNIVIQPSLTWQMSPEWTLGGSYRYRLQDGLFTNNNNPNAVDPNAVAESNLFMLTINYNWQGLRISR